MTDDRKGCLAVLARLLGSSGTAGTARHPSDEVEWARWGVPPATRAADHVYRLRDDFVSRAEASFFHTLRSVVRDQVLIFPKVNLADLVYAPRQQDQRSARNRIDRKHVDFVLCDPATLRPIVAIELDDRSHQRQDRMQRDAFLDDVLRHAGLQLLRFPAGQSYSRQVLKTELSRVIPSLGTLTEADAVMSSEPVHAPSNVSPPDPSEDGRARPCERCGGVMRIRVAKQGGNVGNRFWGCENYPRCRNVVPI